MRLILATYATTCPLYMTAGKLSIEFFKIYSYFFQTSLSAVMIEIIGQPFDDAFGKILLLLFRIEGPFFRRVGNEAQFQKDGRHIRMEQHVEIRRPRASVGELRRLHVLVVDVLG